MTHVTRFGPLPAWLSLTLFAALAGGDMGLGAVAAVAVAGEPVMGLAAEQPAEGPFVKTDQGYMVPYKTKLPGSDVEFEMVPIPGGKFRMGSPEGEAGRDPSEGPQFEVEIAPFWIGKYEVTWSEYHEFTGLYGIFKAFSSRRIRVVDENNQIDAVTAPTELYEPPHTYAKGKEPRQPAVTMTQYAARQYTKWLTLTGNHGFYRLPTEAEWEYACRAGASTAYSFGDDPSQLGDYAWFASNSGEKLNFVGLKKPNRWGLYDMHGNVAEWVMDEMLEDGYQRFAGKSIPWSEALVWPTNPDPRVVRGGHWGSSPAECRSSARLGSNDTEWKGVDPNLPLSPWWFTSDPARGVGFRLVRPLQAPARAAQERFWKADAEDIILDVEIRLEEGRGTLGLVDPALPAAIKALKESK